MLSVLPWVGLITGCLALLLTATRQGHGYTYSAPTEPAQPRKPTPHSEHYEYATFVWQSLTPVATKCYPPDACPLCGTA